MTDYPEFDGIIPDPDLDDEIPLPELPKRKGRQPGFDTKKAWFLLSCGISQSEVAGMVKTNKQNIAHFVKSFSEQTQEHIAARAAKFAARQAAKAASVAAEPASAPAPSDPTPDEKEEPMSMPTAAVITNNITVPPNTTAYEMCQTANHAAQSLVDQLLSPPPWYEATAARIAPVLASLRPTDTDSTLGAVHHLVTRIVTQDFQRFQSSHGGEPNAEAAPQ